MVFALRADDWFIVNGVKAREGNNFCLHDDFQSLECTVGSELQPGKVSFELGVRYKGYGSDPAQKPKPRYQTDKGREPQTGSEPRGACTCAELGPPVQTGRPQSCLDSPPASLRHV